MIKHPILKLLTMILCFTSIKASSQIAISNKAKFADLKNGTTFIAMKNPDDPSVKEYIDVIKDNWKLSKYKIIKYSEIEENVKPNNYFLTIGGYETNTSTYNLVNGTKRGGINYSNTHLYLSLWTPKEKYFKKKKKKLSRSEHLELARIELFTDFPTLANPQNIYLEDFHGGGHIRNWSAGILKNQLQVLTNLVESKKERKLYAGFLNKSELKKLKTNTLFVPEYTLFKFNKFSGSETKKHDKAELFKGYKKKYEIVSMKELSEKILTSAEPIYYLIYIKSSTDKFVSVINSKTGELIYSKYSPTSYNIKSKDLAKLNALIR